MANKRSKVKKKKSNKETSKDRKKRERSYGEIVKFSKGQKRVLNPKRHKKNSYKGTRKNK